MSSVWTDELSIADRRGDEIMKNEILVHEALCVFGEKPQTPEVKRAANSVRRAAAILSFKEWDVNGASRVLECEERAVRRMLAIFGSPGFEDISVLWFPDGKFLVYLREGDDDGREPPF